MNRMMDKRTLERLQEALERATQALSGLESALDAGDNQLVGARLYELRRDLLEAARLAAGNHDLTAWRDE